MTPDAHAHSCRKQAGSGPQPAREPSGHSGPLAFREAAERGGLLQGEQPSWEGSTQRQSGRPPVGACHGARRGSSGLGGPDPSRETRKDGSLALATPAPLLPLRDLRPFIAG